MPIEISWQHSGRAERHTFDGRGPFRIGRSRNRDVVLDHPQVSRLHAEVTVDGASVRVEDKNSQNGTRIDGRRITTATWSPGEVLQIGPISLRYAWVVPVVEASSLDSELAPSEEAVIDVASEASERPTQFPGALFDEPIVSIEDIKASDKLVAEIEYLAIGGGCGSFCWVDHLRCYGVPAASIRVVGVAPDKAPYAKWGRLCRASQIDERARIRSNSISTPDNIWGFPGYASREFVRDLAGGRIGGFKHILQVFGEPILTESYTPRLGDVFKALDTEAERIGWGDMWVYGQVLGIRKTDDDRYVIAYRVPSQISPDAARPDRERFI
ncbi:MAG: FHA domain-containing protein, partial [Hyphomicrobiaceae bacterium]